MLVMFFFMEETMYYRPPVQEEALDAEEESASDESSTEKSATRDEKTPTSSQSLAQTGLDTSHKKTFVQKLKFWGARRPGQPNHYWRSMWFPISLLRFPVVVFAGILVGSVLSWFNVVNATAALILAGPPYNFSTEMIGVMFIAPVS